MNPFDTWLSEYNAKVDAEIKRQADIIEQWKLEDENE